MKARAGLTALTVFLTVASIVAVLWYGASAVISGEMTGGQLSQFIIYALFVAGALGELAEVWGEISQARVPPNARRNPGCRSRDPLARQSSTAALSCARICRF